MRCPHASSGGAVLRRGWTPAQHSPKDDATATAALRDSISSDATLDPGCVLQSPQGESAAAKGEEAAVAVRQADNRNTPAPP